MNDQQRFREAAGLLREYADDLNEEIGSTIRRYPPSPLLWDGPAADRFYNARQVTQRNIGFLADALVEHAGTLEHNADELDAEE